MAKSFYAALIGISIDRGEIQSLDEPVANYLDYFNDGRREITIRQLLNMSSGLDMPVHEHEEMFFPLITWTMPSQWGWKSQLTSYSNTTM